MNTLEVNLSELDEIESRLPQGAPVVMLNLLRYRPEATYTGPGFENLPDVSGRAAYLGRYLPAFNTIASPLGTSRPLWLGSVRSLLVGPPNVHWDDIALIEYETFRLFRTIVEGDRYRRDAAPHRRAALEDWQLLALVPLEV